MYFEKQPREETTIAVAASGWRELQRGESIVQATVEITLNEELTEGIYVSHSIDEATVYVRLRGGSHGNTYKVTVLGTTDAGHVREVDVIMKVLEK